MILESKQRHSRCPECRCPKRVFRKMERFTMKARSSMELRKLVADSRR